MSALNGHAPTLPQVREQIELIRLQDELRDLRRRNEPGGLAREQYFGYTSNQWGGLVDPADAFRDAGLRATPYGTAGRGDRRDGHNRPFVWAEIDLDFQRAQARWIATKNHLGVGLVETISAYAVRTGYRYEVRPRRTLRNDAAAKELARIGQGVLDDFTSFDQVESGRETHCWAAREHQAVEKGVPDGEVYARVFDQGDGTCLVRWIEPEQIRQPPGTGPEWAFGLEHAPRDAEKIVNVAVDYDSDGTYEVVPASDVAMLRWNVPATVKRGLSDFYSTAESLDLTQKLLRNMVTVAGIQAALPWIEQFDGATFTALQAHVNAAKDQNHPQFPRPFVGRDVNYRKYEPGEIPVIGAGRTYVAQPANVNSAAHAATVQAAMRAVGVRWGMAEHMVSGDASNANYSSTLVAGAPFVVRTEARRQQPLGWFFVSVMWKGPIRSAARAGRFVVGGRRYSAEELSCVLDVVAIPPQVAVADPGREADVDHKDLAAKVMSKQTRRERRGLDDETERSRIEAEARAEAGTPPPAGGEAPEGRSRESADWEEGKHERAADGKFGSGGGGEGPAPKGGAGGKSAGAGKAVEDIGGEIVAAIRSDRSKVPEMAARAGKELAAARADADGAHVRAFDAVKEAWGGRLSPEEEQEILDAIGEDVGPAHDRLEKALDAADEAFDLAPAFQHGLAGRALDARREGKALSKASLNLQKAEAKFASALEEAAKDYGPDSPYMRNFGKAGKDDDE